MTPCPPTPDGCSAIETDGGARLLTIHYRADEDKRSQEWLEKARVGVPTAQWRREMELDSTVYDGEAVYSDYNDDRNCPAIVRGKHIEYIRGCRLIGGWDAGLTMRPAFVLIQISPKGQIHVLLEVTAPNGNCPMEKLAPLVLRKLQQVPGLQGNWDAIEHVGDRTITSRSGTNGESAADTAKRYGIYIKPLSNAWMARWNAVTWALTDDLDSRTPRLILSDKSEMLRKGFLGAYKFDHSGVKPEKNEFSDPHDALQYAVLRARYYINPRFISQRSHY